MANIDESDHDVQQDNNNEIMNQLFSTMFPDLPKTMIYDVARIVTYLYETKVNPDIIPGVIRSAQIIASGTGRGQVIVHIRKGTMNVETREISNEEVEAFR